VQQYRDKLRGKAEAGQKMRRLALLREWRGPWQSTHDN
jgi:hypothetical protein